MSKDYYKILEIDKNASQEEIKKAFRKLAHKYHPDKKDGDEKKFKEVNEAYGILGNSQKRAQYDQFGSSGFGGAGQGAQGFSGFEGFDFSQFTHGGFSRGGQRVDFDIDLNDILGSFFGGGQGGWSRVKRGPNIKMDIEISFKESILGTEKEISIRKKNGGSEKFKLKIPAGIDSGEMLRVKEKGEEISDGYPGDLYIKIHVKSHKTLRKEGAHLITEKEIKITESIIGTEFKIETVDQGEIKIKVPPGIKHGEILRVRGQGVALSGNRRGDLLIKISIKIPNKISKKAQEAIEILKKEGL